MSLLELLTTALGVPLAKFLLKSYLGETADDVGSSLVDIARGKLKEYSDQREARRQFEGIADRVTNRLVPLFEGAIRRRRVSVEAVVHELAQTLDGKISAEFFLRKDLDPALLSQALRQAHPLKESHFSADETALYNRALDESVRYLVEIAAQLPKFEPALAAESLQRLSHIGRDVDHILEIVERIETHVLAGSGDSKIQRYEADYRQAVIRNLDYVELFGADIAAESRRQSLSVAYVSLSLHSQVGTSSKQIASFLPADVVLDHLGSDAGRLLIRGEAGSGKSTFFRWVALQAAAPAPEQMFVSGSGKTAFALRKISTRLGSEFLRTSEQLSATEDEPHRKVLRARMQVQHEANLDSLKKIVRDMGSFLRHRLLQLGSRWRSLIPFLIRLRDCRGGRLPQPGGFPLFVAKELGNPPEEWVTSILRSGRGLVLLDGVDEIPTLHRDELQKEIQAIVNTYPGNYFVVSTRPAAVPDGWLAGLGFREATVNPMSDLDKSHFIDKWHEAVARELERQGKPGADVAGVASELKTKLADNPGINRLAGNPLLCAMICALHRERTQKLPESQAELCEALCQMLLHRRERESGLDLTEFPESYRSLLYEQKRAIVQELAHYMVRNSESSVPFEQAEAIVGEALNHFPGRTCSDASTVCRGLVERSGVLRDARPNYIDFIHNTVKEYLAADGFVEDNDAGLLASKALDPAWQPVVLFAVATRKRGFATEVIQKVLQGTAGNGGGRSKKGEESRSRKLFALQCRAVALHLDPNLDEQLSGIEKDLFPPRTMADAEALAIGGDSVVQFLRYRKSASARQTAACVRTLRLIGTDRSRECLRDFVKDRRTTVVSELAHAINPLEIAFVQELLSKGKTLPRGIASQVSDLSPLRKLPDVTHLDLSRTKVVDLTAISALRNLRSLDLAATEISDLTPLAVLKSLESLDLCGTKVSDLRPIAGLKSLKHLSLTDTRVEDLRPLEEMVGIQSLDLSSTRVSDLSSLAALKELRTLELNDTAVADLGPLRSLTCLEELWLMRSPVSDLGPLSTLSRLSALYFGGAINDVSQVAALVELRSLTLWADKVSDLRPLNSLRHLESLSLLTADSNLTPLAELASLKFLDLSHNHVLTDITALAGLKNLLSLDLSATKVSDLTPLQSASRLRTLNLAYTPVSDVKPLSALKELESVDLTDTQVSDFSAVRHVKKLRKAKPVGIKGTASNVLSANNAP